MGVGRSVSSVELTYGRKLKGKVGVKRI